MHVEICVIILLLLLLMGRGFCSIETVLQLRRGKCFVKFKV